jgi:hypothetical protein
MSLATIAQNQPVGQVTPTTNSEKSLNEEYFFDVIPDGFEWGNYDDLPYQACVAMFAWDSD